MPQSSVTPLALHGTRVLSLALNLPGPAALMRCAAMGAQCVKLEPPPRSGHDSADPMAIYSPASYAVMHQDVRLLQADLKAQAGRELLEQELAQTDVLLTSFRPSALAKLGLDWPGLHGRHPQLSLVRIVGAAGEQAELPGHDLTYQAEAGLIQGTDLPPSLYADMAGALMASEAVLQAQLLRAASGRGQCLEIALADGAAWLAQPLQWGLTRPTGDVGGAHAGYRVYACADGRVAVAALEPHFMTRLSEAAGLASDADPRSTATHQAIAAFIGGQNRAQLQDLALARDIPLHTLSGN
ncbi:CoA transferase [Comamonas composti]|uniref:CoA transferase n=1 Tax=Comamonas composti TaxID=408558 RepID=UPI0004261338|nr:CoA transferase [Comamonas composti]